MRILCIRRQIKGKRLGKREMLSCFTLAKLLTAYEKSSNQSEIPPNHGEILLRFVVGQIGRSQGKQGTLGGDSGPKNLFLAVIFRGL